MAVTGKGTAFPQDGTKVKIADITDGTSNTIMVVEADDEAAVPWTKPADLPADPKQPTQGPGAAGETRVPRPVRGRQSSARSTTRSLRPTWRPPSPGRRGAPGNLEPAPPRKAADPGRPKSPADLENDLKQIAPGDAQLPRREHHFPPAAVRGPDGKPLLSWRVAPPPVHRAGRTCTGSSSSTSRGTARPTRSSSRRCRDVFKGRTAKLNAAGADERGRSGRGRHALPRGRGAGQDRRHRPTGRRTRSWRAGDGRGGRGLDKPDDLPVDPKDPLKGLARQEGFPIALADGSVGRVRGGAEPASVLGLFTRNGAEADAPAAVELARPNNPAGPLFPLGFWPAAGDWSELEAAGFDLNKLRRFLKDGIGDQVGFHMHDASKLLDYDVAGALGGTEVMGQRRAGRRCSASGCSSSS